MSVTDMAQGGRHEAHVPSRPARTRGLHTKVLLSGVIKGLQLVLGVGASLLLARLMGPAAYGAYSFALALATLLAIPAQLGWPTLLTREVARSQHEGNLGRLRGVLQTSSRWTVVSSLVVVLLGVLIATWTTASGNGHDSAALLIGCALIPPTAWIGLRAAALRGMDRVLVAQVLDGIIRPALFLLLVAGAFLWGHLSPANAMLLQVGAVLASLVFGSIVLTKVLPVGIRGVAPDTTDAAAWRRSLWPLMFVSAAQIVTSQADLLVLGLLSDTRTVGIYKVAVMVGIQVGFATWLVNAVFAPRIVRLHRAGDIAGLRLLMRKGIRYALAIAIPATAGVVILGRPALDLFLGAEYKEAYWPMVIIAGGQLLGVTAGPVGVMLGMTGHERLVAIAVGASALVSVILTAILAANFGAVGAAVALASALLINRLILKGMVSKAFPGLGL